jgi:hypothetical protein
MTGDIEIRTGDRVVHRETGKRGRVLTVLSELSWWSDDLSTITPRTITDGVVVQWRDEPRPTLVAVADLNKVVR